MVAILQIMPTSQAWEADGVKVIGWALIEEGVGTRAVVPLIVDGIAVAIAKPKILKPLAFTAAVGGKTGQPKEKEHHESRATTSRQA